MREIILVTLQGLAVLASFAAAALCYGLAIS
jgi:hypothetical protein